MRCGLCEDSGWVCKDHPHKSWMGAFACTCGGPSLPCPWCNSPKNGEPPRMRRRFKTIETGSDAGR